MAAEKPRKGYPYPDQETLMKPVIPALLAAVLPWALCLSATAHEIPAPAIVHNARDGVVRLYGAGGPDTAFRKVATAYQKNTGVQVVITAGPEPTWTKNAQANADILWGTAEQDITAFLETYKTFSSRDVMPIYIRPAIIAVQKGNPKGIRGFDDLLKNGMKIVVTEGSGVANTSGTGVWEDVAGRLGSLDDVKRFRTNIASPSARAAVRPTRPSSACMPMPGSPGRTGRSPTLTRRTWCRCPRREPSGATSMSCWLRMPTPRHGSSWVS